MDKKEFRKEALKIRNSISPTQRQEYDNALWQKILSLNEYKNAQNILLFSSTGSEVNTLQIFNEAIKSKKNVYFPKCENGFKMSFYKISDLSQLKSGMYGILEPEETEIYKGQSSLDLLITPALSVGKDFSRIGYGKGYYDRFLKDFKGISVCPIYNELLCESVPVGEYDIPLDIIITPSDELRR